MTIVSNTYAANHLWMRRMLPKASYCSIDATHKSYKYEWSSISRQAKRDLNDYRSLCQSCHRKYDITSRTRELARKNALGNTSRRLSVIKISDTMEIYSSIAEASIRNSISRTSIINCLKGRSKTAGGFKWQYQ